MGKDIYLKISVEQPNAVVYEAEME